MPRHSAAHNLAAVVILHRIQQRLEHFTITYPAQLKRCHLTTYMAGMRMPASARRVIKEILAKDPQ